MKQILLLIIVLSSVLICNTAYAHENGPPFVKINNKYTISSSNFSYAHNPGFILATDVAPEQKYVVNEEITFSIDEKNFFNPYDTKPAFRWGFGDYTKIEEGLQVKHTYTKPGSYFMLLLVRYRPESKFTNIDLIQIDIVPSKDYKTPQAKISVNGQTPDFDTIVSIRPNDTVEFDAGKSTGKIKEYFWELGDGTKSQKKQLTHTYKGVGESSYFPVLRVVDEQNISNDSMVYIESTNKAPPHSEKNWFATVGEWFGNFIKKLFSR